MSVKIRKGDTVRVIAGKDKDKEGKVLSVDVQKRKVIVEGVNMITKSVKPNAANQQGGIVNKEAPIDVSNVMYVEDGKVTRLGYTFDGDKKVRVSKKSGKTID
ncbi:MAG: 50S ribosomal protein L24 [Eubacterium sp.]|jgi:large subunit ribosomal protein L24|uniref:Large ribosomal subunit protein uL24 n=1 Tax=Eubacterium cellulosolvens (strain ATCC 43171 / JCM 9499 / 6) TaxID=633697 RepID=I5AVV6_EUBC6|nr:50S ribosomal protein L24 [Eubacterium sp.]